MNYSISVKTFTMQILMLNAWPTDRARPTPLQITSQHLNGR